MSLDKNKIEVVKAGNTATVTYTDENAFYEGDITKAELKRAFDHSSEYITECATLAADVSTDIMKSDKKIDNVVVKCPYGVSKRGSFEAKARRSVTFRGIGDHPDVTRSDLKVVVTDPLTKVSKSKLKDMQAKMTSALLD